MSEISFPDYSAQEEMIECCGDAELLYKSGKKIMRYQMTTYGCEGDCENYDLIKSYMTGSVLNIGLGMGNSVDMILDTEITDLIVYEIEQDIIDLYESFHSDERLTIYTEDAFENKPEQTFDIILFEVGVTENNLTDIQDYLTWAFQNLNANGYLIIPYDRYYSVLIEDYGKSLSYITKGSGMSEQNIWILCQN